MSGSLSRLSKVVSCFLITIVCFCMPVSGRAQAKEQVDTTAVAGKKKVTKSKKVTRKRKKRKAKASHQEIKHSSENDSELEKIKAEKNKQKGIK